MLKCSNGSSWVTREPGGHPAAYGGRARTVDTVRTYSMQITDELYIETDCGGRALGASVRAAVAVARTAGYDRLGLSPASQWTLTRRASLSVVGVTRADRRRAKRRLREVELGRFSRWVTTCRFVAGPCLGVIARAGRAGARQRAIPATISSINLQYITSVDEGTAGRPKPASEPLQTQTFVAPADGFRSLDLLRAVSAQVVVIGHCFSLLLQPGSPIEGGVVTRLSWFALGIFSGHGFDAVAVFFVLSGLLVGAIAGSPLHQGTPP